MTDQHYCEYQALCNELPLIEERLWRAGMYETALKVREAVKGVGFEAARVLTVMDKTKREGKKHGR